MPVNIHKKHGYIIGGVCDQTHRDRSARERGGEDAIDWLKDAGAIRPVGGGWWRLTKREVKAERELDWRGKEAITGGGAQRKIGCYRVFNDLLPLFRKKKKVFRLSFFMKCVEDIEGLEFGMAAESPLGPFTTGYVKPHRDAMYQTRKKGGDFNMATPTDVL